MARWRSLYENGKGIDQSVAPLMLRGGRLRDGKNLRLTPPATNRAGLGKRPGLIKAFQNAVGQATAGPTGIPASGAIRCIRAANQTVNVAGNVINVEDLFDNYSTPNLYGGTFYTGTDFKGNYVIFAKNPALAYAVTNPASGVYPNQPFAPFLATDPRVPSRGLRAIASPVSASLNYGLAINYRGSNRAKVTVKIEPDPFGNTGADYPTPGDGQCTRIGVFVRGSENLGSFVCAYLEATSTDTVRIIVERHTGGAVTANSLTNTYALSRGPGPSVFSLELVATSNAVTCRFVWGDQGIDDTVTLSEAPWDSFNSGEDRVGIIFRHSGTAIYRDIVKFEYSKIVPLAASVLYHFFAADADPTQGRWQIPKGWDSIYITNATVQGRSGASTAYSENGSRPTVEYPTIDKTGISPASGAAAEPQVYGGLAASETGSGGANAGGAQANVTRLVIPSDYAADAFVDALTETARGQLYWNDNDGTIDDSVGFCCRVSGISGTYP